MAISISFYSRVCLYIQKTKYNWSPSRSIYLLRELRTILDKAHRFLRMPKNYLLGMPNIFFYQDKKRSQGPK